MAEWEAKITLYRNGRRVYFNDGLGSNPEAALYAAYGGGNPWPEAMEDQPAEPRVYVHEPRTQTVYVTPRVGQPIPMGTVTRCAACSQIWPCPMAQRDELEKGVTP